MANEVQQIGILHFTTAKYLFQKTWVIHLYILGIHYLEQLHFKNHKISKNALKIPCEITFIILS